MTDPLLPSMPKLAVAWGSAHPALAAIHGGRFGTRLAATLPAVRVTRIGSAPTHRFEDSPVLQFECWANDEGGADLLARTLVASLPTFLTAQVRGFRVLSHFWSPDLTTDRPRYIVIAEFLTYA